MPLSRSDWSRRCSRPFILSTLILTALLEPECREVHHATDQCAFVLANCSDDEPGLFHYLSFYYCTLGGVKPVAFAVLVVWLGLLFSTIGIAASDFFSVNLSTIASVLGLSESLAGVTFLAFGNGSPDVFSTFAAMGSNSGSMAVGELIGAAGFITAVVAGSMALVREFRVSRKTFVRDILFFIVAVSFSMVFLADGELHLWECMSMIGFYLFYVIVVVGWHWWTTRRRAKRLRDAASRGHFHAPSGPASDELEPYQDDVDDDEPAPMGGRSASVPEAADLSALERAAPRIEVEGVDMTSPSTPDDEDELERLVAAEMTSSMRVMRPRWGRSNTTITAIRPSLIGALEFRSVLASLQKARNMKLTPLLERPYSDIPTPLQGSTDDPTPTALPGQPISRERALSSGNMPLNLPNDDIPRFAIGPAAHAHNASTPIDGLLTPYPKSSGPVKSPRSSGLQLQIPSPTASSSAHTSPALSPFPMLSESPAEFTSGGYGHPAGFSLPSPVDRRQSIPGYDEPNASPKPVRWWPYKLLPAPHVIYGTLFPTLQGWKEKTVWDKLVSLISVPSILALVTTLPVVETERDSHDGESTVADPPTPGSPGRTAPPIAVDRAGVVSETEWQEYRRRTRSNTSRSQSTATISPLLIGIDPPSDSELNPAQHGNPLASSTGALSQRPPRPSRGAEIASSVTTEDAEAGWNRWLVAVQIFTGPFFVVIILWANMREDLDHPGKMLLKMILCSLLTSLCILAVLLTTTSADRKPKYHFLFCFLGFVISVAWISTVAGEVVGVLKAFGVILGISEAILGLTIFAVGNSLGDLVADVTVARLGYPVMALAACFGGPMLNILLGVGIGGAWMGISSANEEHRKHPERPLHYEPYRIQVGGTLLISAVTVLLTLIILLIAVPSNRWIMSRKIGWGLVAIWTVGTALNLVFELTGTWSDVS
ncbi:hypothetical protein GQ53DRAFT_782167 [Thozetella sp. PMI_491]|nr:hypothetical protein GQ53DRAFT_782167 [Thozetella sp. PMI_491]